jgi:hypothetical protein
VLLRVEAYDEFVLWKCITVWIGLNLHSIALLLIIRTVFGTDF